MNNKFLGAFLLTLIASLALVSAAITVSQPGDLTRVQNTTTFTITNTEATDVDVTIQPVNFTDGTTNYALTLSQTTLTIPAGNTSSDITLTLPSNILTDLNVGSYPITLTALVNSTLLDTKTFNFVNGFCDYGDVGTGITITDVTDEEKDNEDPWVWEPLNNIEITITLNNNLNEDKDLKVEYYLYNPSTKTKVDINAKTISKTVDSDDSKDVTITFQVPSKKVTDSANYQFYIKAYEAGNEDTLCTDKLVGVSTIYYKKVDINKKDRYIIIDSNSINLNTPASCGDEVTLTLNAINVGNNKEKRVLVNLYNRALGVDKDILLDSMSVGDKKQVTFTFNIPQSIAEKTYNFDITTYYDYDDSESGCSVDTDLPCYQQNSFDDQDTIWQASLKVEGCKVTSTDNIAVTASLVSLEALPGQEVVIKANVKNNGNADASVTASLSGYESFASSATIDQTTFTLKAGESKDLTIRLKLNDDASGDNSFNLKTLVGTTSKDTKIVLPTIQSKANAFSGLFSNMKSNWIIWVIVIINIVLIVLIIVVAVRIIRK